MMPWGSFFHPRDGHGRESRTLWFVALTWMVMTLRFLMGGVDLTAGWLHWAITPSPILDYGAAVSAILAVWVGREWVNRKVKDAKQPVE